MNHTQHSDIKPGPSTSFMDQPTPSVFVMNLMMSSMLLSRPYLGHLVVVEHRDERRKHFVHEQHALLI